MSVRVLGLDPGVSKAGWAVVEVESLEGKVTKGYGEVVDYGIFTPRVDEKVFNTKLNMEMIESVRFFREKIAEHGIVAVAWEIVPAFARMSQRDRVLGVATSLKFVTWDLGLVWFGSAPVHIKKMATGNAKASKRDMKDEAFRRFPSLPVVDNMPVDTYDAMMVASTAIEEGRWHGQRF